MPRPMIFRLVLCALLCGGTLEAYATFSIVAIDPQTGEVGSAGASCIAGSIILSDPHPGVGVVHTQAYWNAQNQAYASMLMDQGYSPDAIIDSLVANDAQNNPTIRQYGVIDLVDGGRSAAYTGVNCTDYANHILGPVYAVQGNILLGPEILDGMVDGFVNTPGPLSDKLMAALQGAKVVGADTRCLDDNKSSISAFIRVARPDDGAELYLDLNVNNTGFGQDPIDVLQDLYDEWKASSSAPGVEDRPGDILFLKAGPNPFHEVIEVVFGLPSEQAVILKVFDVTGRDVTTLVSGVRRAGRYRVSWSAEGLARGIYVLRLDAEDVSLSHKVLLLGH